ncbi:hypothetical protein EV200_108218 [Pedobacter psychrotolerans]|uniref:GLPGLI family protein n=1 Tax=Pedobacter psychrotolerans TaxID=1843235 RepID=A0A4R2H5E7_9SPHI|nr:hypothetical protein [Pedobacter psychrotolerans]TCO20777.1 hypothetical protein EV200_108218 [Pedobacter psychrotolerans]GGE68018.1 hypothetical protein GCM10011413_38350 [Pedobacter psychrotolerans]
MKTLLTALLLIFTLSAFAQKSDSTIFRSNNIRDRFLERYTVLKSNKNIKNGFAEILFNQKQIASGYYQNNERVNQWKFYFLSGEVEQIYNYSTKKVEFEFESKSTTYHLENVKEGDEIIYPVKIGGAYGAILVMNKISSPVTDLRNKSGKYQVSNSYYLDELGNVTKLEQKVVGSNYSNTKIIDRNLFRPEELACNPGYVNGKPVKSTITISHHLTIN